MRITGAIKSMSITWKAKKCWNFCGNENESPIFTSVEEVVALDGELVSSDKISLVKKIRANNTIYYVKIYWRNGNGFRSYLGRGRLQGEWENLLYFSSLGIKTPRIVAYGQTLKKGFLDHGVLVTEEVKDSLDLLSLTQRNPALLRNKSWLNDVMTQIADSTRRLHDQGFVHWDLKWRNILVSIDPSQKPCVYFFDCPLGKKRFGWLKHRGAIKDIACLDKVAEKVMTNKDRLKFFKYYVEISRIQAEHKRMIRKILTFF